MMFLPIKIALVTVLGLLGIGFYGLLITRNLIKIVVVVQILVKTVLLALVLAGKFNGQLNLGQSLAVTVIVADTIVAVIGLALAVQVQRHCGTLDVQALSTLQG
jgi:NADH:ubiquinone oxidoreductase subunit K